MEFKSKGGFEKSNEQTDTSHKQGNPQGRQLLTTCFFLPRGLGERGGGGGGG